MSDRVPPYFTRLIAAFRRGQAGRGVHLGYWDDPANPHGDFAAAQDRLDEVLLAMAGLAPGQALLDAGCGLGGTLARINREQRAMALAGVNVDPRQLEVCRGIAPANGNTLRWDLADACRLPYAGASFERVLCVEAMFHFSSRRAFFAEAARVLKPGGALVASDIVLAAPAPEGAEDALRAGFGPWPDPWGADADHRALAQAAGLRCTAWQDAAPQTLPSHRHTAPSGEAEAGDATARAAQVLRWLHANRRLQYPCMRFDKETD